MSKMNETELRRRLDLLAGVDPSPEATRRTLDRVRQTLNQADAPRNARTMGLWRIFARSKTAALAVAAMLMVGYVMLFGIPPAQAVTFAQVREALQKAGNVCITSLLPNRAKPSQTEWISRTLDLSILDGRDEGREVHALWSMSNRTIYIRPLEGGEVKTITMSDEVFARGRKRMVHATGLVPFDEIADLPEGSTWEKVTDPNAMNVEPGAEVYDLVWTKPIPTIPPTRQTERFRFFVDPRTHLPSRVEMYSQEPTEPQPRLFKTLVVTFPTDMEMQTLVRTLFPDFAPGPAAGRP